MPLEKITSSLFLWGSQSLGSFQMNSDSLPRPRTLRSKITHPRPPPTPATEFEAEESPRAPGFGEALGKRGNRGERDARLWALDASKFTPLKKEPSAFPRLHQNDKCKRKLCGGTDFKKGGRGEVVSQCAPGEPNLPGEVRGRARLPSP